MFEREVKNTKKDSDGDILALCNSSKIWSPRQKFDVISEIENGNYRYYVRWKDYITYIKVVNGNNGKYLRTDHDDTTRNNLNDLPDC